jgi:uncharacterized protein with HEPN domain
MQFVPSEQDAQNDYGRYCQDGIDAIDAILAYIAEMTFPAYERDRKTRSAVEREILIIAEVIRRMPEFESAFGIAHRLRGFANRLRHEYDSIDDLATWDAVAGPRIHELRKALQEFSAIKFGTRRAGDDAAPN